MGRDTTRELLNPEFDRDDYIYEKGELGDACRLVSYLGRSSAGSFEMYNLAYKEAKAIWKAQRKKVLNAIWGEEKEQ